MDGWLPMNTAPKNGESVLIRVRTESLIVMTCWWEAEKVGWQVACMGELLPYEASAWRPLSDLKSLDIKDAEIESR